jgi:outer membrane biosynthesis protein TonB
VGSVILHGAAIPIVYSNNPPLTHTLPSKSTHLKTPIQEIPEITLGIDVSEVSTLTWIGYEEYEEQRARFAEVEQASMQVETPITNQNLLTESFTALLEITAPITKVASDLANALQGIVITTPANKLPIVVPTDKIPPAQKTVVTDNPQTDNKSSDRDSEATSLIHISADQWKSGKPLAAKGIVLRPRRPSFTANQLVSNTPGNLVAELHIDKNGKPMRVLILVSTGSRSIDRSLESSLYRWRASGEDIDALKENETIEITIHIKFSR